MNSPDRQDMVVFSENDFDRDFLKGSLGQYFSEYLNIIPLSTATRNTFTGCPKVVVANIVSLESARRLFPGSQVVYTQRLVSGAHLEELLELPPGTRVLVANKPYSMAAEAIQNLTDLGIDHIRMTPYCHGCGIDTAGFEVALYTGTRAYCPDGMRRYIDIGYRNMSQSTLAAIMKAYDIPFDALNIAYHQNAQLIVRDLYRIQYALHEAMCQRKNFEQTCALSANALIVLDAQGNLVVFNPAAETLFGLAAQSVLGKVYTAALHDFDALCKIIARRMDVTDRTIYVNKHAVLTTMRCITQESGQQVFLSLIPVESLLNSEEKARADIYKRGFVAKYVFDDIQGTSPALMEAVMLAKYYARTDATVLITGESGTGKELFAQSIHNASPRAKGPFIGVNFAAIPESLIESELFGYDEGAFTGARKGGKSGLFRSAHHGTIFLDEIGDVSPSMQSRLLRVLEEREIMPVGSSRVIPVDVRIVCATNRNLPQMVAEGKFREDLYYRLKVLTLQIPSLRERKEDIPAIFESVTGRTIPPRLAEQFLSYDWPGNIRELKSIVQQFSLFSEVSDPEIEKDPIWSRILTNFFHAPVAAAPARPADRKAADDAGQDLSEGDLALLRCVHELCRAGQSAGRYSLARHPEMVRLGMTEARIKLRLSQLKARGYLLSGKTRQGVALSARGCAAITDAE